MKNVDQWSDNGLYSPGQYKSFENATVRSTGKIHAFMLPNQVAKEMEELVSHTNEMLKNTDINGAYFQ